MSSTVKIGGIVGGILTGAHLPVGIKACRYFKLSRLYLVLIKKTLLSLNIRGCQQPVLYEHSQIQKHSVFLSLSPECFLHVWSANPAS